MTSSGGRRLPHPRTIMFPRQSLVALIGRAGISSLFRATGRCNAYGSRASRAGSSSCHSLRKSNTSRPLIPPPTRKVGPESKKSQSSRVPTPPQHCSCPPKPPFDPFSYGWRRSPYSTVGAVPPSRHRLDPLLVVPPPPLLLPRRRSLPPWPPGAPVRGAPAAPPPPEPPLPSRDPARPRSSRGQEAEGEKWREAERDELRLAAAGEDAPGDGHRGRGSRREELSGKEAAVLPTCARRGEDDSGENEVRPLVGPPDLGRSSTRQPPSSIRWRSRSIRPAAASAPDHSSARLHARPQLRPALERELDLGSPAPPPRGQSGHEISLGWWRSRGGDEGCGSSREINERKRKMMIHWHVGHRE
jgi:hypothetical protein